MTTPTDTRDSLDDASVERAAMALWEHFEYPHWNDVGEQLRGTFRFAARAALLAAGRSDSQAEPVYRLLNVGETICEGDEVYCPDFWQPANLPEANHLGRKVDAVDWPFRRRFTPPEPVAGDAVDARRYRWLQGAAWESTDKPCCYLVVDGKLTPIERGQLDAAIDAAMKSDDAQGAGGKDG